MDSAAAVVTNDGADREKTTSADVVDAGGGEDACGEDGGDADELVYVVELSKPLGLVIGADGYTLIDTHNPHTHTHNIHALTPRHTHPHTHPGATRCGC